MQFNSKTIQSLASNKMSQPFYKFDGINDQILVSNDATMNVGDCNFSYLVSFRTPSNAIAFNGLGFSFYRDGGTTNKEFFRCSSSQIEWYLQDGTGNASYVTANFALDVDTRYTIVAVADRSDVNHLYINGRKITISGSSSVSRTNSVSHSADLYIGNYASQNYADGELYAYQRWNKALLQDEARALSAGGAVPFKYKGAKQTNNITHTGWVGASTTAAGYGWTPEVNADYSSATTGGHNNTPVLTIIRQANNSVYTYTYPNQNNDGSNIATTLIEGKMYRASIWVKSGTAGNVSASLNIYNSGWGTHTEGQPASITSSSSWQEIFLEFVATGGGTDGIFLIRSSCSVTDTTQLWSDPQIIQVGCVAEYDGSGISSDKWFDKSGNDLHGTVTGATVENAPSGDSGLVYEEGSWTPSAIGFGGGYDKNGSYFRVGKLITARGYIQATTNHADSSHFIIGGLPYIGVGSITGTWGAFLTRGRYGSSSILQITDMFLHKQEANDRIAGYDAGGDLTYTDVGFDSNQMIGFVVIYECV